MRERDGDGRKECELGKVKVRRNGRGSGKVRKVDTCYRKERARDATDAYVPFFLLWPTR